MATREDEARARARMQKAQSDYRRRVVEKQTDLGSDEETAEQEVQRDIQAEHIDMQPLVDRIAQSLAKHIANSGKPKTNPQQ